MQREFLYGIKFAFASDINCNLYKSALQYLKEHADLLKTNSIKELYENCYREVESEDLSLIFLANDIDFLKYTNEIPKFSFQNLDLMSFEIPAHITSIGEGAFMDTTLRTIIIPGNVVEIGHNAFLNCSYLKEVVMEEGVKTINDFAFYAIKPGAEIYFPRSIEHIDNYAIPVETLEKINIFVYAGTYAEDFFNDEGIIYNIR